MTRQIAQAVYSTKLMTDITKWSALCENKKNMKRTRRTDRQISQWLTMIRKKNLMWAKTATQPLKRFNKLRHWTVYTGKENQEFTHHSDFQFGPRPLWFCKYVINRMVTTIHELIYRHHMISIDITFINLK